MMRKRFTRDPVDVVAALVATMALRECAFLDELPAGRFMDLVADEVAREATRDRFIARPPYFLSDLSEHRRKRYMDRIVASRAKLKLIPSHLAVEWMAARTALSLRQIMSDALDDPNELSRIEQRLAERLEWTAMELTG